MEGGDGRILGPWEREGCPSISLGAEESEPGRGPTAVKLEGKPPATSEGSDDGEEWEPGGAQACRGPEGWAGVRRPSGVGEGGCPGRVQSLSEQPGNKVWGRVGCPGPQGTVPPQRAEAVGPRNRPHL